MKSQSKLHKNLYCYRKSTHSLKIVHFQTKRIFSASIWKRVRIMHAQCHATVHNWESMFCINTLSYTNRQKESKGAYAMAKCDTHGNG